MKFIFQFEFWSWNSSSEENIHVDDPFWWPRLVGVIQSPTWSIMELLQLLAIFFHLSLLKVREKCKLTFSVFPFLLGIRCCLLDIYPPVIGQR